MASTSGLRVLLALGQTSTSDLEATERFLAVEHGCIVTCVSSGSGLHAALAKKRFDIVVAEQAPVKRKWGDADVVDGLAVLKARGSSPVAVLVTSLDNEAHIDSIVKAGAVDVLMGPLSGPAGKHRLSALLARAASNTLKLDVRSYVVKHIADARAFGGTGVAAALTGTCADLEFAPSILGGPHEGGMLGSMNEASLSGASTGTFGHCVDDAMHYESSLGGSPQQDSFEAAWASPVVASPLAAAAVHASDGFLSVAVDKDDAFLSDPFALPSESCCFSPGEFNSASSFDRVSTPGGTASGKRDFDCFSLAGESLGSATCSFASAFCLSPTATVAGTAVVAPPAKRTKLTEWSAEQQRKFAEAVEALGAGSATPTKVLELMGTCAVGISKQAATAQLQKYRAARKAESSVPQVATMPRAATVMNPFACCAPATAMPAAAVATPQQPVLGVPCYGTPSAAAYQQEQQRWAQQQPWSGSMLPTCPQQQVGAVPFSHAYPQAYPMGHAAGPCSMIPVTATTMQQPVQTANGSPACTPELCSAISEVLRAATATRGGAARMSKPIGLKLDVRAVMDAANKRA